LKQNATEKLKAVFLPFTLGPHYCTLVFKDKDQGEFVYEVIGEASLPAPIMEAKGTVPLEGPTTFDIAMSFANGQLDVAKRLFLEKHPLSKEREQAALLKADVLKASELEYTVTQTNSLISCPSTLILDQGGAVDLDATSSGGGPRGTDAVPTPRNGLRLMLKPIGTGIYPTRLMLTSLLDTRVVDLELTAQTMTQQFQLDFSCAVRQTITQDVPLVNTGDQSMTVHAKLDGKGWTGSREVVVPAGATVNYPLQFKPLQTGDHRGTLELSIPSTGEKNVYTLVGKASEPVAEGHIVVECQARKVTTKAMAVPNIVGAPVEYHVLCDLDIVSGPEAVKCSPNTATTYKLSVAPYRSGSFLGSITFLAPDGQLVWYSLEVRASEPPEIGIIDVVTQVRKAVSIRINVVNPTDRPSEMRVKYSDPEALLGPSTFMLPVGAEGCPFEFYYAPLLPGETTGSVTLLSDELGEFWYQLRLVSDPAPPVVLPELTAELGSRPGSTSLTVENPVNRPVTITASSSNPNCFQVQPDSLTLPPYGIADVTLKYIPGSLGEVEQAVVSIGSPETGIWEYHASGRGTQPSPAEPIPLSAVLGTSSGQGVVSWRNPFGHAVQVDVSLSGSPEVELLMDDHQRQAVVGPQATLNVPLSFRPSSLTVASAELAVTLTEGALGNDIGERLVWLFPIKGVAEAKAALGTVFKYRCKARSVLEETLEVVLTGLAQVGPDEGFTHEVVVPPDAKANLDAGVLSITPVETRINSPTQPLTYKVRFAPQRMFNADVEFIVHKNSGGRWRFEMQLQASEPDLDGVLTIEAAMDQTATVPIQLFSSSDKPQPFTASFTSDTPIQFNVLPQRGMLPPAGQQGPPPLQVTYTCRDFGKVVKGRLFVQTPDTQYCFELRGKMPTYVPPTPAQFQASIDNKLSAEMTKRLATAASPGRRQTNFITQNIRTTRGGSASKHY